MTVTRELLLPTDAMLLLEIIKANDARVELRVRCASLIISPKTFRGERDPRRAKIIRELNEFLQSNLDNLPWQLARAIALAIANRTNSPDAILSFLARMEKEALVEENLRETDQYYGSPTKALEYFIDRLMRNSRARASGCVWEAYYVSRRCEDAQKQAALKALRTRAKQISSPELLKFWTAAINHLEGR